jgi:hypothetical protein
LGARRARGSVPPRRESSRGVWFRFRRRRMGPTRGAPRVTAGRAPRPAQGTQRSRRRAGQAARQAVATLGGIGIRAGRQALNAYTNRTLRAAKRAIVNPMASRRFTIRTAGSPAPPLSRIRRECKPAKANEVYNRTKSPVSGVIGSNEAVAGVLPKS